MATFWSKYALFKRIRNGCVFQNALRHFTLLPMLVSTYPEILKCQKFHVLFCRTISLRVSWIEIFRGTLWLRVATEIDEIRETTALSVWKKRISNYSNLFPIPALVWLQVWRMLAVTKIWEFGNWFCCQNGEGRKRTELVTAIVWTPSSCQGSVIETVHHNCSYVLPWPILVQSVHYNCSYVLPWHIPVRPVHHSCSYVLPWHIPVRPVHHSRSYVLPWRIPVQSVH